jgi:hypothetical protein
VRRRVRAREQDQRRQPQTRGANSRQAECKPDLHNMPDHNVRILMSPCAYFAPRVRLERAPDAPRPLRTKRGEPRRIGIGLPKRPIYTSVRMLKTRPKSCHFVPLFAGRGRHRWRNVRAVCRIGARGSELVGASSGDARKKWQMRVGKWHKSTPSLFTMSRGRVDEGNQARRARVRSTSTSRSRSRSKSRTQAGDARVSDWSRGGEGERGNARGRDAAMTRAGALAAVARERRMSSCLNRASCTP